ncbi:MAG: APC family permease [Acidobacteria bacterium]|nr:APC family permease [Acidobacteriota bacterium]MBI3279293.1 APC family permease [Acidobacteriota bacterium]
MTKAAAAPRLQRALSLWGLIFTGIILIQPTAPMPLFGVVYQEARGHVVTTVLIAMCAMFFTAISYGRMARAYPSAGSAYTYVGQELHPALGFLTGWSMLMDYVLNPVICTIWCSKAALNIFPDVPYAVWTVVFAVLFAGFNLRAIQATARTNAMLVLAMSCVVVWMLMATVRYVLGLPAADAAFFTQPFYDPATFSIAALSTGTSIAVLTFIGFDGISTLSEEVVNPRRNILLGTVLTCLIIGALSAVEVYAAQLVWPANQPFPDVDTAYVHAAGRAGGRALFHAINFTLIIATIGSGAGGVLAGARLLYGMGRDNALPRGFFGYVDPRRHVPRNNIILIGVLALAGSHLMSYQLGAELLNFGAFIGFMGVNLSAFARYWLRADRKQWTHLVPPLAGFLICAYIWWSLRPVAKIAGAAWIGLGLIYGAVKTRGFRGHLVRFEVPPET